MGCFWSREDRERCYSCKRRAVNNLIIIDRKCQCCRSREAQIEQARASLQNRPCFGEYRCPCGRFWASRLSWRNRYQICKLCRTQVHASYQRELRKSDWAGVDEKRVEHSKELCEVCQDLGQYCGAYKQGVPSSRSIKSRLGPQRPRKQHTTKKVYGGAKFIF